MPIQPKTSQISPPNSYFQRCLEFHRLLSIQLQQGLVLPARPSPSRVTMQHFDSRPWALPKSQAKSDYSTNYCFCSMQSEFREDPQQKGLNTLKKAWMLTTKAGTSRPSTERPEKPSTKRPRDLSTSLKHEITQTNFEGVRLYWMAAWVVGAQLDTGKPVTALDTLKS